MENSRSTRGHHVEQDAFTPLTPRPAQACQPRKARRRARGGVLAQDGHRLEQRGGDPPAQNRRCGRAERKARLDAEAFHEGFLQGGLDVFGRPVSDGLQGGQGGVEHLREVFRQTLAGVVVDNRRRP